MSDLKSPPGEPTFIRPSQPQLPTQGPGAFTPPRQLGRFTLQKLLGRGGMAAVFLAQEQPSGRLVALKLMDPNLRSSATFVERFVHEAKSCASLHHPNIVEVHAWGEEAGWHYLACEYIEGGTVANLIAAMRSLPAALAAELLAQLLSGLAHAHQAGVVHRDLKPENLLMTQGGILKIADFGIARTADGHNLTKTGMLVGTAGYMSPEQAKGLKVDNRSDLFTAGIILYEMLTGANPFASENAATSITRILTADAPPLFEVKPTSPGELEAVLDRLLCFEPDDRFARAEDGVEALMPFISERRRLQPTLVAECMKRPQQQKVLLEAQASGALVNEVRGLVSGNALEMNRAAIKLHLAAQLDPSNAEANQLLASVSAKMAVNFGQASNPKIDELERSLAQQPKNPVLLAQLAQLYKLEGNILRASIYLKRYLRVKPGDTYTANQLYQLLGERPRSGPTTGELTAGVKTGGFKAPRTTSSASLASGLVAPPTVPQSVETGVKLNMVEAKDPRRRQLIKLGVWAVVAVIGIFVMRGVFKRIDDWGADSVKRAELMRKKGAGPQVVRAAPDPEAPPINFDQKSAELLDEAAAAEKKGDFETAITLWAKYGKEFPKRPQVRDALFHKAKLMLDLRRNNDAREAFDEYLTKFPGSPDAAEALLRRGEAASFNLDDENGVKDYDAFISQHPSSVLINEALVERGEARARMKNGEGAKADFRTVLDRVAPSDPLAERASSGLKFIP